MPDDTRDSEDEDPFAAFFNYAQMTSVNSGDSQADETQAEVSGWNGAKADLLEALDLVSPSTHSLCSECEADGEHYSKDESEDSGEGHERCGECNSACFACASKAMEGGGETSLKGTATRLPGAIFPGATDALERLLRYVCRSLQRTSSTSSAPTLLATDLAYPGVVTAIDEIWQGPVLFLRIAEMLYGAAEDKGSAAERAGAIPDIIRKAIHFCRPHAVLLTHVERRTGFALAKCDMERITGKASGEGERPNFAHDPKFILDGAQAVGNRVVNLKGVEEAGVDYYATSGRKFLGSLNPIGLAFALGEEDEGWDVRNIQDPTSGYAVREGPGATRDMEAMRMLGERIKEIVGCVDQEVHEEGIGYSSLHFEDGESSKGSKMHNAQEQWIKRVQCLREEAKEIWQEKVNEIAPDQNEIQNEIKQRIICFEGLEVNDSAKSRDSQRQDNIGRNSCILSIDMTGVNIEDGGKAESLIVDSDSAVFIEEGIQSQYPRVWLHETPDAEESSHRVSLKKEWWQHRDQMTEDSDEGPANGRPSDEKFTVCRISLHPAYHLEEGTEMYEKSKEELEDIFEGVVSAIVNPQTQQSAAGEE